MAALVSALLAPSAHALDPTMSFGDYAIDNWNVESGLPQVSILSVAQDHTGYVWISTQNGIARFDGLRFEVYNRHNSDGANTNDATYSLVDRTNRIWFGGDRGALLFSAGKFEELQGPNVAISVRGIAESADGSIFFATPERGVLRYSGHVLVPADIMDAPAHGLLYADDALWIGGVGALSRWSKGVLQTFPLPPEAATAPVMRLAADKDVIWLGTGVGLFRYENGRVERALLNPNLENGVPPREGLDGLSVESLFVGRDRNLWVGTPSNLFRRRPTGSVERVRDEDLVRSAYIVSIFEDREGNLWFGSRTEGLFRLWNGWARRVTKREGLPDQLIWSVTNLNGKIVLGSNGNVVQVDADGLTELIPGRLLPNPSVYELNTDQRGRLWIGTRAGIAIYYNGEMVTPPALQSLRMQFNVILPLADGSAWFGTSDGLYQYRDDSVLRMDSNAKGPAARIRAVHPLDDQTLLFGTEDGIRRLRDGNVDTPDWARPFRGTFISAISEIRPGLIGITTRDSGLGLLSDDHLLILTAEHGLPTDNGWALDVVDGQLYVPTINGVWRVPVSHLPDPSNEPARAITAEIVLGRSSQRMHCCNGGARARSLVDGSGLWYPAIQGAVRIETKAIQAPRLPPTAVVEGLRHDGDWHPAGGEIEIADGSRDVELQFSGLSFRDPKNLHFRYRLEGYDAAWQEAGARRSAFYTNLPPGHYRLLVQTSLGPSVVSARDGEMNFYLVPRWYERSTVRGLALVLALVLLAIAQWRLRERYRRRGLELEALIDRRTVELRQANAKEHDANEALLQANGQLRTEIDERENAEAALRQRNVQLQDLNQKLEGTQNQLLQSEKLASVGQLAAGVAHEINNPIGFVRSNLSVLKGYVHDLFGLIGSYEQLEKTVARESAELVAVQTHKANIELDYLREDSVGLLAESMDGITRVEKIVSELKEFSHLDDAQWQKVDLHRGLDSTLGVAAHELRYKAEIVKEYGELPLVECLPFQINQVFLSLLVNAVQAIPERGTITLRTGRHGDEVWVQISDNGSGIPEHIRHRIFEPFFTTKPVGKGTGLGLSVSYGIIQKHEGRIDMVSEVGKGTTFTIHLPIRARGAGIATELAASAARR